MSDELGYQVLESQEADFEKMTWTFGLQISHSVTGGHFCIIPVLPFTKAMAKLSYAEELLRGLVDKHEAMTDYERERIAKFFDPEPLG